MCNCLIIKAYIIIVLLFTVIGCSSPPLKPIEVTQRHSIIVHIKEHPLKDQFISRISALLSKDFLQTLESEFNPGNEMIRTHQNYFSYAGDDTTVSAEFILVGEIENAVAGESKQVDAIIKPGVHSWLQNTYNHYADKAAIKYRFKILDASHNILDSLEIIGECSGNKTSDLLIDGANANASLRFGQELLEHLSKKYNWEYKSRLRRGTKKEINEIKRP